MESLTITVDDILTRELAKISVGDLIGINETGRPIFDGKDVKQVLAKLSYASAIGSTVKEACLFAGISVDSYYRCAKKNPEFRNTLEQLRSIPKLQARITIMREIFKGNLKLCKWYFERALSEEFALK